MNVVNLFNTLPGNGWLTIDEAELLWDISSRVRGPILEVGCYYGRSTCLLAAHGRLIYAVDPFADGFDSDASGDEILGHFRENLRERQIDNVHLFREKIEDWIPRIVGFAYLDGDHSYVGTLHQLSKAHQSEARHICVHDYSLDRGGLEVKKAIEDYPGYKLVTVVGRMAHCIYSKRP